MKSYFATFGLAVGVVSAASAQLASPASGAGAPANSTSVAAAPPALAAAERGQPDPYAPLWQCRQFVREFLSLSSQARPRRLQALEACIAEAERNAEVEVAGP